MGEEEQPQETQGVYAGQFTQFADKGTQQWRNDFTQEIKELRITLTHKDSSGEKLINEGSAALCTNHFNMILPILRMTTTKGWTLSRLHEEVIERYVVDIMDSVDDLLQGESYHCEECGCYFNRNRIRGALMAIEAFIYGNCMRAGGGYESEKLSTMQQVTSHETVNGGGGGINGLLRRGKWR